MQKSCTARFGGWSNAQPPEKRTLRALLSTAHQREQLFRALRRALQQLRAFHCFQPAGQPTSVYTGRTCYRLLSMEPTQKITFSGWNVGMRSLRFAQVLHHQAGLGLKEA